MTTTEDTASRATAPAEPPAEAAGPAPARRGRQISVRSSTVLTAALAAALTATSITFGALWLSDRGELRDRDAAATAGKHAEQVAMDYAVGASTIDYRDTKSWFDRLKAGTAADLATKFDSTAPQLEQILLPLQWSSKAAPLRAAVTSVDNGIYQVDAFLNVSSTSVQTPQGGSTTVTYRVTIDEKSGWKITAVGGGIDGAIATK
ncbi:hypothetical protein ACQP06_28450 [Nocardia sp. CA-136227]|uniref:hypothetical protein n=1 Tax=Nocardia sp. CA-136227 TaxID=3239979 RepID=UPI003D988158